MFAQQLATLLAELGVDCQPVGRRRIRLHLPDLPPGTSLALRLDRYARHNPDDAFHGWSLAPRVAKPTRGPEALRRRRVALWLGWGTLHRAGLLPEPPPDDPAEVALPTDLD